MLLVTVEHLGDVYYEIGLFQEAVEAWEEALELKYLSNIQRKIDNVRGELAK